MAGQGNATLGTENVKSRKNSLLVEGTHVSGSDRDLMVGLSGLEPPTSPLSGARSSHLSYRPNQYCVGTNVELFHSTMPLAASQPTQTAFFCLFWTLPPYA